MNLFVPTFTSTIIIQHRGLQRETRWVQYTQTGLHGRHVQDRYPQLIIVIIIIIIINSFRFSHEGIIIKTEVIAPSLLRFVSWGIEEIPKFVFDK